MRLPGRSRTRSALLCLAVLLAVTGCGRSPADEIEDLFSVAVSPVSADRMTVHDMVQVGPSLVALASTDTRPAGFALRSDDGGLSWNQFETPLSDAIDGFDIDFALTPGTHLLLAGSWLVAFRYTSILDEVGSSGQQAVAVSDDLGSTWQLIDLPAPAGSVPFVWTAAEVDGRLTLGGTVQAAGDFTRAGYDQDAFDALIEAYDAALWVSSDPGSGFERLAAPQFDALPAAQLIRELVPFDGRLIALGGDSAFAAPQCCYLVAPTVAWESRDGGASWSPMAGLRQPGSGYARGPAAVVIDGRLVLRTGADRAELAPGSSTWTIQPLPEEYWPDADQIALPDGSAASTWSEDAACDCSVAYGGRLEDNALVARTPLRFDDCEDESVRGWTEAYPPGLIGDRVGALASCDDRGVQVASLAYSLDGGTSWETSRLNRFAPERSDLTIESFLFLPEDGVLVALLSVLSSSSEKGGLVSLRISSTA